jgi:hypothetical protein
MATRSVLIGRHPTEADAGKLNLVSADARFDELDKLVEELKRKEKVDGRKKRK